MTVNTQLQVVIDGEKYNAQAGQTILDACKTFGIPVPTLCHHRDLPSFGACRICLVQVEGMRGYPPACTTPVSEGMVVKTTSEELNTLRKGVLELILSEHPSACLVCNDRELCEKYHICHTKAGRVTGCSTCPNKDICQLREVMEYIGLENLDFPPKYKDLPLEREDPFFDRDYNLCILCGRCVRVCQEIRGIGAIAFTKRGHDTKIGTAFGKSHLEGGCQFCGACVDVCPTGALSDKGTKWQPEPDTTVSSTCNSCSAGCSMKMESRWNIITSARPESEGPSNRGQACVKGRFCIAPAVNHANRIKFPMVKKEGILTPVEWNEAITAACDGLKKYSGDQIGVAASSFLTNEAAYLLQKFARSGLHTPNIDNTSLLSGAVAAALQPAIGAGAGTGSIEDIEASDTVLLIGTDVCSSHPVLNVGIVKARRNGAMAVHVSTENSPPSRMVDRCIDTDDLVETFASVLKLLAQNGVLSDAEKDIIDALGDVAESKASREIAALFDGKSVSILFGEEILGCTDPERLIGLLYNISVLSGNKNSLIPLWTEGNTQGVCDMGALPGFLPGWRPADTRGIGYPEMAIGKVKALYITEGTDNPLKGIEFLILQDIFPSALMESADVVLPAAAFTETSGTVTSLERRILPVNACANPPGMALADWEIITGIAAELGVEGFAYTDPEAITAEILQTTSMPKSGIWSPAERPFSMTPLGSGPIGSRTVRKDRYRGMVLQEAVEDLDILYNVRGVKNE